MSGRALARVTCWVLVGGLLVGAASAGAAMQRFRRSRPDRTMSGEPQIEYDNIPYNGRFTFARIRFRPSSWGGGNYAWGLDLKWNHDYPRADQRLEEIIELVTGVLPNTGASNILAVDDPELFRYPWAYLCEVGFLTLDDSEAESFRNYLLKGGFVVVDDFDDYHWYNFLEQMERVIPEGEFIEIDETHPIFHAFFEIDDVRFGAGGYGRPALGYGWPRYYGLFEDNDPTKRLMMIANYNNDIGEYWEFADSRYGIPIDLTNDAYKLGVNYVIYSMTH